MERLPWLLELPANASGLANYLIDVAPAFENVVAVHATGWSITASAMPPKLKVTIDSELGHRQTGYYAIGTAAGTASTGVINNGLLIMPNTTASYDRQEYESPRLLFTGLRGSVRRVEVQVSDFAGGPAVYSGTLFVELMVTVDTSRHRYLTPPELPPSVLDALNGYFVNAGKRPRA